MSVSLEELLKLDIMKSFRIVAGKDGLKRQIRKVGILDHELGDVIDSNFIEGEFVLTNLLLIKDDLSQLEDIVRRLIGSGTGGLAVKTLYIDDIPGEITTIADKNQFPIFLYERVYYEDIITELVEYIKRSDELGDQLALLKGLNKEHLHSSEVQKLAYKLNPDFKNWVKTVVVQKSKIKNTSAFSPYQANQILGKHHRCYSDSEQIYLLLSFDEEATLTFNTEDMLHSIGIGSDILFGGESSVKSIEQMNMSLIEADYAARFGAIYSKEGIISFEKTGMYQVLMPLSKSPWMETYYKRLIEPLQAYDEKNGADLLRTAITYIDSGCDIKATAQAMYQHGNTIRYRLDRIRALLENRVDKAYMDQELALAVRLHLLKKDQEHM